MAVQLGPRQRLLAVLLVAALAWSQPKTSRIRSLEGGLSIACPGEIGVKKESPVEDFVLYRFSDSSGPFLLLYLGNQPQPLSGKPNAIVRSQLNHEFTADVVKRAETDGTSSGQIRVVLARGMTWPSVAQFEYEHLSRERLSLVQSIAASLSRQRK